MTPFKTFVCAIVAALAATFVSPLGLAAESAEPRRHVVEIRKFKFVPEILHVRPGDIVVWTNRDIVPHTATSSAGAWDSGGIAAGGAWETVVTDDMAGQYFCRFHPSMLATIKVAPD